MIILERCGQPVLVVAQQFFQGRLGVRPLRIGLGVFGTAGTAHHVDDGLPEFITGGPEFLSVIRLLVSQMRLLGASASVSASGGLIRCMKLPGILFWEQD